MGAMRFLVPRREYLPADALERAYLAGIDEIPWPGRLRWNDDALVVEREQADSGNLFIPALIDGHREVVLSTASLMEREQPYHLDVELARGTLNRLRNYVAGWESMGSAVRDDIRTAMTAAQTHFSLAATRQDDPMAAAEHAARATRSALDAMDLLADAYAIEALAARRQQQGKLSTLVGCNLGSIRPDDALGRAIAGAFNSVAVPLVWRDIEAHQGKRDWTTSDAQVEWCRAQGLRMAGGPLLEIDKWSLPDWMVMWGGDLEGFRSCVAEHVHAVVTRYRGRVQLWHCAARLNVGNDFGHDEEQRLRLAALTIESIRRADSRAPIVLSVDQPWGAFMSQGHYDLAPLHFVDALVRAELGLAGIGLEINFAYAPGGSDSRDVLEFSRQIDRFSMLGLPVLVVITAPSAQEPDPLAASSARAINYSSDTVLSRDAQAAWGEEYLSMLLAKQPVQAIIWNQLSDSQPHAFAHGGLLDAYGHAKPILEVIRALRGQYTL